MARVDCTNAGFKTFRALIVFLRENGGIAVDHFHAVDSLEVEKGRTFDRVEVVGGGIRYYQDWVFHLNFVFDKNGVVEDAAWSSGNELDEQVHPLDQDPRGWHRLVADERHER
ncbi:MAG: hypothetical protein HYT37_04010 [Candidatus Sungbacteria bacterium]|nr:hypothetical protein [Candidatus Sungbacteria bacterium]